MAKWFGVIGFAETVEVSPGVWIEQITERNYYGELIRNARRLQSTDKVNDDINISNNLSILSDPYAIQHFHNMRYAGLMGVKWKISDVEVQYPRLSMTLGGVYNGEQN